AFGLGRAFAAPESAAADPAATRSVVTEVVVDVSADEFWKLVTTAEGIKKIWGVAQAEVDFRPGGTIRTSYDGARTLGDGKTITHHITAYEPGRVLVLKTDPPADASEAIKLICREGWVVMRMDPVDAARTRITETMLGFGEGPLFDEAYEFFKKGNA